LDNEDFNLESLRGKYVWVKFTATWCGPCNLAIPGMREAYERWHDKGFEIVSVYISQNDQDPIATVRKHVEEKKIPWIILSEELSKKAGQPGYWDEYSSRGVPTMMLLDKEGKIMALPTHGSDSGKLIAKLAEIFE
jgi:thiol-disulfide isomerase/thioredoxin